MLTERENFLEVIRRGKPDRFANQYDALRIVPTPRMAYTNNPKKGEGSKVTSWGYTMSWTEDQPGMFPVHKPGTIVMPDIEEWKETVKAPKGTFSAAEWEPFIAMAEKIDRNEYLLAAVDAPGTFELCHNLGEITNVLMAFYESPDELKELIKYITEWRLQVAEGICTYMKPDALFAHDDWGTDVSTFVSPEMFDEFFLDSYKELYGYYHSHGVDLVIHHSDSYAATLVPSMIEMGIDVWQGAVSNNDIPAILEQYGGQISIMGGLNSTIIDVPDWSHEVCYDAVKKVCDACGPLSFIPCQTSGVEWSTFPGVYEEVHNDIAEYSKIYFAEHGLD